MHDPFRVVREFEHALCTYTGARYAVTTNSCTMAILLAVAWHIRGDRRVRVSPWTLGVSSGEYGGKRGPNIQIPKRTYISVPMSIIHAGGRPTFRDEAWTGAYELKPLNVWDCARRFTSGMYTGKLIGTDGAMLDNSGNMQCVSFHQSKILGDSQGGAILHDNAEADIWLRKARFDGRTEGVPPIMDTFDLMGYHCYMSPDVAARLLWKLSRLPHHNDDLPNDDYPDLSTLELFK